MTTYKQSTDVDDVEPTNKTKVFYNEDEETYEEEDDDYLARANYDAYGSDWDDEEKNNYVQDFERDIRELSYAQLRYEEKMLDEQEAFNKSLEEYHKNYNKYRKKNPTHQKEVEEFFKIKCDKFTTDQFQYKYDKMIEMKKKQKEDEERAYYAELYKKRMAEEEIERAEQERLEQIELKEQSERTEQSEQREITSRIVRNRVEQPISGAKHTRICVGIVRNNTCNKKDCVFSHTKEEIMKCVCINQHNCFKVVKAQRGVYTNKDKTNMCMFLHNNETFESFSIRVELSTFPSIVPKVVQVAPYIRKDIKPFVCHSIATGEECKFGQRCCWSHTKEEVLKCQCTRGKKCNMVYVNRTGKYAYTTNHNSKNNGVCLMVHPNETYEDFLNRLKNSPKIT